MDGSTAIGPMFLVLKSSPEQEQALQTLLRQQQDKGSPNYHRWLTPEEFGTAFGAEESDIQQITDWLTNRGFTIRNIALGRRSVTFSGTAAQVEEAFHTEMHNYLVKGERHFSNSADISLPEALGPVVTGVSGLNDFKPRPAHTPIRPIARGIDEGQGSQPALSAGGNHYLAPGDFSIIYNTQPLLLNNVDGNGVTIAIVGASGNIAASDPNIEQFRSIFLPNYNASNVNIIPPPSGYGCGAPLTNSVPWDEEAYLDLEWSGAVAPNATIDYVPSGNVACSAGYVVETNSAPIISMSVQACEAAWSSSYAYINVLWEQAAAQGITVFVSAGDGGSAGCDDFSTESVASQGYAVNGLASTAFNVAVGGSEFNEGSSTGYWNPTNSSTPGSNLALTSAAGYIPENTWNESAAEGGDGIWAGGGGISQCTPLPWWQTGPGVPQSDPVLLSVLNCGLPGVSGQHRYLPDVSLSAAGHDGYITCLSSAPCTLNPDGSLHSAAVFGGTSASSPAFAGIQALIDQQYGRQGQANCVYYQLAALQNTTACNSMSAGGPASSCVFNDITVGGNGVPCQAGSANCPTSGPLVLPNFNAGTGYDLATGLGSVNASNLFNQWDTVGLAAVNLTPLSLAFPSEAVSTTSAAQSVTVTNTGTANLIISTVTVGGTNASDFAKSADNCTGATVTPSNSCTVSITFTPSATGNRTGSLSFFDNTANSPQTITLTGTGTMSAIAISGVSPGSLTLVQGGSGQAVTVNLTRTNYTNSITLATSTLPTGVTATYTQPGTGNSGSITLQAASNAALVTNQTVTITASGSGVSSVTSTFSLTVNAAPSIAISNLNPSSLTLVQGGSSQAVTVNLSRTNYTDNLTLAASALPTGVTATYTQPGTGNSGSISLQAASNATPVTNQTITITASGSGVSSATSTFSLTVNSGALASLSPQSLNFAGQGVSTASASQPVTLSNIGTATLNISGITITGGNSGDFTQTSTCTATLAAGANCTINVTFKPTATGMRSGTLSISDDAAGSPHTVALAGTGTDFALGVQSGGSTSETVGAGQTATYHFEITPTAFSGSVALTCSWAGAQPRGTNCTVSPTSVNLDGTNAAPFTVTVATTARSLAGPGPDGWPGARIGHRAVPPTVWLLALMALMGLVALRRRRVYASLAVGMLFVLLWAGCGGGGGGGGAPPPTPQTGTPAGTYTLTVTGSTGSGAATLSHNVTLTLTVN
jgi:subtilase family serine protease